MQETPMPDPKDNAKMTGDTHPPEVESDLPLEEGSTDEAGTKGSPQNRGRSSELGEEGRPSRAVKKAGLLKSEDDQAGDAGETPGSGKAGPAKDRR
jgi:hypothetical protein